MNALNEQVVGRGIRDDVEGRQGIQANKVGSGMGWGKGEDGFGALIFSNFTDFQVQFT